MRAFRLAIIVSVIGLLTCGCAGTRWKNAQYPRAFEFHRDTFAFPNELVWEYSFAENGKQSARRRDPPAEYSHHCFVLARAARQFFQHARFDPYRPAASEGEYRQLIRAIMNRSPRRVLPDAERIVVPGYDDLKHFSRAHEQLLKAECGGAYQSYLQRGHWRIMLPFTREHQQRVAAQLLRALRANRPPVAHIIRFPELSINHAIVFYARDEQRDALWYFAYDPNSPEEPIAIRYDYAEKTFHFPRTHYFRGGPVDVYEVFSDWNY